MHVAAQQFPHVGGGEDVRIDDYRMALVAHQLGGHEPGRGERLQVVIEPDPLDAVAQVLLAFTGGEKGVIPAVHDLHVELVVVL